MPGPLGGRGAGADQRAEREPALEFAEVGGAPRGRCILVPIFIPQFSMNFKIPDAIASGILGMDSKWTTFLQSPPSQLRASSTFSRANTSSPRPRGLRQRR